MNMHISFQTRRLSRGRLSMWRAMAGFAMMGALAGCSQTAEPSATEDPFINEAQVFTERFQSELKGALSTALTEAGPVGAVGVCHSAAPAIAEDLSRESGLEISRIARKNRNEGNALSEELKPLYAQLEATPMEEDAPASVHAQIDGREVFMRAIPMQEQPCSVCHGVDISPEVEAAIAKDYPDDRATGFKPGELRGAFLVRSSQAGK